MYVLAEKKATGIFFTAILAMIAATNFTAMMNTTAVTILLPVFMREFQTDIITTQWVVTAYILATCTVAPVVGYLSDRISLKRTFLLAVSGFAISTLLLGLVNHIYPFIALRVLQGIFGGMLMPLTQSMIYRLFPRQKQAQAISIWATTNLLAPTLAPSLAGVISDLLSWRWIFFIEVPILAAVLLAAIRIVPADTVQKAQHRFDLTGLLLSLAGSLCLLIAFSNITVWGLLSAPVLLLTIAGGVSLVLFFRLEGRKEFPLLYVKVFRYEVFLSSVVLLCVGSILINASNNILPVFLQNVRGLTTTQAALVMLPAPLILMFVVPLMGKYYDRIGPQTLLYAITAIGLIACLVLAQIDAGSAILFIVAALILRDIGSGSVNMPATNMGMQAIPIQYATHAAAVTSWIRQCVISLTIGLSNTFQTARTNHYMTVYADTAEPLRYQLSYSHAMSELFYLLTICFVVGLIAVYFSKSRRNG